MSPMHELSITREILNIALAEAEKHGARRLTAIHIQIGQLSGIVPESVQFYLDMLAQGTIAEGVKLQATIVPITARCPTCDATFPVEALQFTCPTCGGPLALLTGQELQIESIEVE